jgi:molybdopterin synthase catalytic subunit
VKVLYFAVARERLGRDEELVELPDNACVADLLGRLRERHDGFSALEPMLKVAVNQDFVTSDEALADDDEVALIPPVSGGASIIRVSDAPLSLDEVVRAVSHEAQGGLVTFTGVVRRHSRGKTVVRLEYEAYRPMAEKKMRQIAETIEAEIAGARLAMVHRVGVLAVGEAAVVIAASAAHRGEAFEACHRAIDHLKESVPIWKKEITDDGEAWIGLGP